MTTPLHETMEHLAHLLGYLQSGQYKAQDPSIISGIIKRSLQTSSVKKSREPEWPNEQREYNFKSKFAKQDMRITNFQAENLQLEWAGLNFGREMAVKIQIAVKQLGEKEGASEIRFWGVIKGTTSNYYVAQGLKPIPKSHEQVPPSCEKLGEGVNAYSFWVCNNPLAAEWSCLPEITPQHINTARKIKKLFTGNLEEKVNSQPAFKGVQKHYLKAQLCRLTHSLQLAPKDVYKPNDENPVIVELNQEGKIPQTQEMNSIEAWVHRNAAILELGRCSHYVDPTLPEDQLEQKMSELAEKDPVIDRLRGITEDKVAETLNLGLQNPWVLKFEGNPQVFAKEEANFVYGVVVIRNIFWPGWVTLGYKNGFTNFYIGDGLKLLQPSWDQYTNQDLQEEAPDLEEHYEPNPKDEPKPQEPGEGQPEPDADE